MERVCRQRPGDLGRKGALASGGGGFGLMRFGGTQIWQERRKDTNCGKIRADVVNEIDAGAIGQFAERRRADATQTERQSEKQTGDHANSSGHKLLPIDQDRGERGRKDQSDNDAENAGPE